MPLYIQRKIHLYLAVALLISACSSNQSKTKILIKELQKNLDQSSQEISIHTSQTLNELQDKTTRPETSERAKYWFPKAQQIQDSYQKKFQTILNI